MPNFSGIWTASQQYQARGQDIWPKPPGTPTIGTASAGTNNCASVPFTAPACTGAYPSGVASYVATSTPGCITASGSSSPLTVTGLTLGTSYTFKVKAIGNNGLTSACSNASNSITATIATCATYTTAGTYCWIAPACVTSVAVVAVGGGARAVHNPYTGGGGGELRYKNNISVTPGNSYTVVVGAGGVTGAVSGGQSYFNSTCTVRANGAAGTGGASGGVGDGGGNGGTASSTDGVFSGGGGAGGYSGAGGNAGRSRGASGSAGSGGGGGGGGGANDNGGCPATYYASGGGGGVGIYGQGCNGAGGAGSNGSSIAGGGGGGSGGSSAGSGASGSSGRKGGNGGSYGGGGGGGAGSNADQYAGQGGGGAVRIVWCICGIRGTPSFPSTNVGA